MKIKSFLIGLCEKIEILSIILCGVATFDSKQHPPFQDYSKMTSKMTSKMNLKFNPDAPEFVPSGTFIPVLRKQSSKAYKYRSKNAELWQPARGWLPFYRCQACREIMTRKIPTKFPQKINSCGHITCAKCIVSSYLVQLNPICPVAGCAKCVNPKQKEPVAPVTILTGPIEIVTPAPSPSPTEEEISGCGFCSSTKGCGCNEEILVESKRVCPCYDEDCNWDCGTLWCGCIDVCRNRCGLNSDRFNRW